MTGGVEPGLNLPSCKADSAKFSSTQAELSRQWNDRNHSQPNPDPRPPVTLWVCARPVLTSNVLKLKPFLNVAPECGQQIRLEHLTTSRNLHSHHFSSPLSNSQEVSAFGDDGDGDTGDVWSVVCETDVWRRDDTVMFKVGFKIYARIN